MGTVSSQSQNNLEKCKWVYVEGSEEEKIHLLEDRLTGNLSSFFFPYFSQRQWILHIALSVGVQVLHSVYS